MSRALKSAAVAVLVSAVLLPVASYAEQPSPAELQAQIAALLAQIQELQAQLAAQPTGEWCFTFTKNLKIEDTGADVVALREALRRESLISTLGTGNIFDETLAGAVSEFQEKYRSEILTPVGLARGNGYVGKLTRAKLNQLYGCGSTTGLHLTSVGGARNGAGTVDITYRATIDSSIASPDSVVLVAECPVGVSAKMSGSTTIERCGNGTPMVRFTAGDYRLTYTFVNSTAQAQTIGATALAYNAQNRIFASDKDAFSLGAGATSSLSLVASPSSAFGTPTVAPGAVSQKIGSYILFNASNENINIITLSVMVGADANQFQNLKLRVGSLQFGPTQATLSNYALYTIAGTQFAVSSRERVLVDVYADVLSSASPGTKATLTTLGGCTGQPAVTQGAVMCNTNVAGQSVIVATGGALQVSLDAASPPNQQVVMGASNVPLAAFRFTETANLENVKVTDLSIFQHVENVATVKSSFGNLALYRNTDQSSPLATGGVAATVPGGYRYAFHFAVPVTVPQADSISLVLKGDVSSYSSSGSTDNSKHRFSVSDATVLGATSNTAITPTFNAPIGNVTIVLRTKLSVTTSQLGVTNGRARSAVDDLGRITFAADPAGPLALNAVKVTFSGTAPATANFLGGVQLFDEATGMSMGTGNIAGGACGGTNTSGANCMSSKTFMLGSGANGYAISVGGSKTFTLRINSQNTAMPTTGSGAATLTAYLGASQDDVLYTDGLDSSASTGIPAQTVNTPLYINTVTYGQDSGGAVTVNFAPALSTPDARAIAPGQANVLFTRVNVALNSATPVTISALKIGSDSAQAFSKLSEIKVFAGSDPAQSPQIGAAVSALGFDGQNYYAFVYPTTPLQVTSAGRTLALTANVPSGAPNGQVRLGIMSASFDQSTTASTGLPVYGSTMTIGTGNQLPDLTISGVTCTPESPRSGEWIYCDITVYNNSAIDVTTPFSVNLQGTLVSVPSLAARASRVVNNPQLPFGLTIAGRNEVNFIVDAENTITESDESNNVFTKVITVQPSLSPPFTFTFPTAATTPLQIGQTYNLTWTGSGAAGIETYQVYLSSQTTNPYSLFLGTASAAQRSFSWTVPSTLQSGNYYQIQLISVNGTAGISPYFSINASTGQSSVTVASPNGGETWQAGSRQTIRWSAPSSVTNITIALDKLYDCNATAGTLCIALYATRVLTIDRVPNTGSYEWTLPTTLVAGRYEVHVYNSDNEGQGDGSDAPFTITASSTPGTFSVVKPAATPTENLTIGQPYTFQWLDPNFSSGARYTVFLTRATDGGAYGVLGTVTGVQQFTWSSIGQISGVAAVVPGADYAIQVVRQDVYALARSGQFTISPSQQTASPAFTAPANGAEIQVNQPYNITWTAQNLQGPTVTVQVKNLITGAVMGGSDVATTTTSYSFTPTAATTAARAFLYDRNGVQLAQSGQFAVVSTPAPTANNVSVSAVNVPLSATIQPGSTFNVITFKATNNRTDTAVTFNNVGIRARQAAGDEPCNFSEPAMYDESGAKVSIDATNPSIQPDFLYDPYVSPPVCIGRLGFRNAINRPELTLGPGASKTFTFKAKLNATTNPNTGATTVPGSKFQISLTEASFGLVNARSNYDVVTTTGLPVSGNEMTVGGASASLPRSAQLQETANAIDSLQAIVDQLARMLGMK